MGQYRKWPVLALLLAGCGGNRPLAVMPEVAAPVAAAPAAGRHQLPWPTEAKDARPVTSEAAAIALVQAFYRAQQPGGDPATESYHASFNEQEWLVSVGRLPATPGAHVLVVVDPAGRVSEIIAGE